MVAVARNGIIGREGTLPWRLSSDLKKFRAMTMGKPLVMGRRTFQSLGKPLDGRDNLVITHAADLAAPGVEFFGSLVPAIARARVLAAGRKTNEIMIIGGAKIYAQTISIADRIYWTEVEADVAGDTSFPAFDRSQWREAAREGLPQGPKDDFAATLITLNRVEVATPAGNP